MLNRLIDYHLHQRWVVLVGLLLIVATGVWSMLQIPIDAFPDLTNNQVVVITECPAMAPVEVEQLVSFPIESALMGIPRTTGIRSISKLGLSMVTLVFEDDVNGWFARQLVNERLQEVRGGCRKDWIRYSGRWLRPLGRSTSTRWRAAGCRRWN